jgi:hypothetical protein
VNRRATVDLATIRFYAGLLKVDWRWIVDGGGSGPPELAALAERAGRQPIRLLGFERHAPSKAVQRLLMLLISAARAKGSLDERMNALELDFCLDLVRRPGENRKQALRRARDGLADLAAALCRIAVRNRKEEPFVVPILTAWCIAEEDGHVLWRWPPELCDYDTLLELAGVSRAAAAHAADEEPDRRRGWKR